MADEIKKAYKLKWKAKDDDGNMRDNMWEVGDMALVKSFNQAKVGTSHNVSNDYWWAKVVGVSNNEEGREYNWIMIDNSDYDGVLNPQPGQSVVMLGNRAGKVDRQSAIYISAYSSLDSGLVAPFVAQYRGINDYSNIGTHRQSYFDANGATFNGNVILGGKTKLEDYINSALLEINNELGYIKGTVTDQEGNLSEYLQTAEQIRQSVTDAEGRIAALEMRAGETTFTGEVVATSFKVIDEENKMSNVTLDSSKDVMCITTVGHAKTIAGDKTTINLYNVNDDSAPVILVKSGDSYYTLNMEKMALTNGQVETITVYKTPNDINPITLYKNGNKVYWDSACMKEIASDTPWFRAENIFGLLKVPYGISRTDLDSNMPEFEMAIIKKYTEERYLNGELTENGSTINYEPGIYNIGNYYYRLEKGFGYLNRHEPVSEYDPGYSFINYEQCWASVIGTYTGPYQYGMGALVGGVYGNDTIYVFNAWSYNPIKQTVNVPNWDKVDIWGLYNYPQWGIKGLQDALADMWDDFLNGAGAGARPSTRSITN